jgi:uncharacterized protein YlxP (DUF503 family)
MEHFRDPKMNALVVRPLVERLYNPDDISVGEFEAQDLTWESSLTPPRQFIAC